jgi:hypothetical protein
MKVDGVPIALSRGALASTIAALAFVLVPSFTKVLPLADLLTTLLWALGCAGWGTAVSGRAMPRDDERTLRIVSSFAIGIGIVGIAAMCLGFAGWLNRATAAALLGCGVALSIRRIAKGWPDTAAWLRGNATWSWLLVLMVPSIALCLSGATILPGVLFGADEPAGYDAVGYHLQVPREWFESGRVMPLWHNTFSVHPMLVEMHYLVAMHLRGGPWAGMYVAQLMHAAMTLAVPLAVYGFVRPQGNVRASLAAIVCATVPWVPMLGAVAYNEGALMLFTVLAIAWLLRGQWILAGAMLGLACGVKYTGFVTVLLLVPIACAASGLVVPRERIAQLRGAAIALAVGVLVASPWLIRNAAWTGGNPVFPLLAGTLGKAQWDDGQVERFEAAHSPREDQRSLGGRWQAFVAQVIRDEKYGAIQLSIGDASAEASVASPQSRQEPRPPVPVFLALGAVCALLCVHTRNGLTLVLYLLGLTAYWLFATHLQGRFFVQAIPLFAIAIASVPWRGVAIAASAIAVIANSLAAKPIVERNAKLLDAAGLQSPELLLQAILPRDAYEAVMGSERPVVLIGDAKAFWYPIPTSRLRYRYVFDVPSSGDDLVRAWVSDVPRDALLVVDPNELRRFTQTYRALPKLDDGTARAPGVFVTVPTSR